MTKEILKVPVFAGLSDASLQLLADESILSEVPAGENVVQEGDPGHSMYIIRRGRVAVLKHLGKPDETELCQLADGDFFGEMCIVEPMPRAATVRTVQPTECLEISSSVFQHLYKHSMEDFNIVILNMARDLARRLRQLDEAFTARAH